jgi:hypothetical protein
MSLYDVYLPKGDAAHSVTVRGDIYRVNDDGTLEIEAEDEEPVALFAPGEWLRVIVRDEKS